MSNLNSGACMPPSFRAHLVTPPKRRGLKRRVRGFATAALGMVAMALTAQADPTVYLLKTDGKLATAPLAHPEALTTGTTITGVNASETLVAIEVRPQNQLLYGLGVDAANDTATLYCISPQTGYAAVVGTPASIAFTTNGSTVVDFPDPSVTHWDADFNTNGDRLRVVVGSLEFRVNPNTGGPVDGDNGGAPGTVAGLNPDGPINGATTTVSAVAYTNNEPASPASTIYTLDDASNSLYLQGGQLTGAQTLVNTVTLGGNPLDFAALGFDLQSGVDVAVSNNPVASGSGIALLNVGGQTGLYSIDLVTGAATLLGPINASVRSMAIRTELGAAIALDAGGNSLTRFLTNSPGTVTTRALSSLASGETMAAIAMRPQTGQFYGLGVNSTTNTATLYLVDPQTGVVTVIGTAAQIAFVDSGGSAIALPSAVSGGYGMSFNPTVDRIRVTTASGLNFRVVPNTGAPVDGNFGGSVVSGVNPDGNINGNNGDGAVSAAYTNSYGRDLAASGPTTLYTIDAVTNTLYIQNPPNGGNQTSPLPTTLGGSPLDLSSANGFAIPASVSVTANNAAAVGEGWIAGKVGNTTSLYRVNLATGAATNLGAIGAGTVAFSSVVINGTPSISVENDQAVALLDAATTFDFGTTQVGSPLSVTATVKNSGSEPLIYKAQFDTGAPFSVDVNAGSIAPGGSQTITVSFTPTVNDGDHLDILRLLTNDPAIPSFDIAVKGRAILPLTDDVAVVGTGDTELQPMANDGLAAGFSITSVSDPNITIRGRTLIIPASFTGSFTYQVTDGTSVGVGTVTVSSSLVMANPNVFSGLVYDGSDQIIGSADLVVAAKGASTLKLQAGILKTSAKIVLDPAVPTASVYTTLGYVTLTKKVNGSFIIAINALGGDLAGSLLPQSRVGTGVKFNVALASANPLVPGGGYAVAMVPLKGPVKIVGVLPDGIRFSASTIFRDNLTFTFYTAVQKGPKPPAFVGGEVTYADLTATDLTGELRWTKLPQMTGTVGLHLGGVEEILTANGAEFIPPFVPPSGSGDLTLSGGNLAATETNTVTVTLGAPAPTASLKTWKAAGKSGTFTGTVAVPNLAKPVKASGVYLPKTKSAWGFFPGTTVGGRIELVVP